MKKILFVLLTLFSLGFATAAVNINTANVEQLKTLPGIGPAKAQAIVDYRTANGNFKTPEDLKKVKGIGDGIFEKVKAEITVAAPAPQKAAKPAVKK